MKTQEGFQQCYNGQAAVDEGSRLIVAADLTNQAPDNGLLLPMVEQAQTNTGMAPQMTLADAGYASEATFVELESRGLPASIALGREDKKQRKLDPERSPATGRMAQWLKSAQGKEHYRWRKTIPEPVFGWIKQALGFRRLSMRGLEAARAEWSLICMAVNLRRMQVLRWQAA